MTTIDEKEILAIEKLKEEVAKIPLEVAKIKNNLALNNKRYFIDIVKVAFYGIAVGAGGTFAITKTLSSLE